MPETIVVKTTHRISSRAKEKLVRLAKKKDLSQDALLEALILKAK